MSFTLNTHNSFLPSGSLMEYLGPNNDPSGWVICNGEARDNSTGLYNTLISLGIGSSNITTYIPPNFKNKMLYGSPNGVTQTTGGNSTVTLSISNMPSHNHTIIISDPGHSHSVATTSSQDANGLSSGASQVWGPWSNNNAVVLTAQSNFTGITATAGTTGSGSSFSILPPYVTVHFILKI